MESRVSPQNLIRQASPELTIITPGFYKQLVFDILTVVLAAGVGYVYAGFLNNRFVLTTLLFSLLPFLAISVFQTLFTKNIWRRLFILILETASLLFFFIDYELNTLVASAALIVILSLWGEIAARRDMESNLEIRFFRVARLILSKLATALLIVFIILYIPKWNIEEAIISEDNFRAIFDLAASFSSNFYPEIGPGSTFSDLAQSLAKTQLKEDPLFLSLSSRGRADALNQVAQKISQRLGESLNIEINPDEPVSKIFYDFIIKTTGGWRENYGNTFFIGWGVAMFFVLRGLGVIFYWIASFLSFIIYQIFLASGFIHIVGETRTKEVLGW